jgi:hypothetical protein
MMHTITRYDFPADAAGDVEIRMPVYCTVLGLSSHGRSIVVRSPTNDEPDTYAPKRFIVVVEGADCSRASSHRYLGDFCREINGRQVIQYVFEWIPPLRGKFP